MIGSTTRPIDEIVMVGGLGTSCAIDVNGTACSSDENLKTNITDLSDTLSILSNVRTVTYNWNANPNGALNIGFLAQDLQQYYPELVRQGHDGYLQVNYAGMTPILTKAIQELDLKITNIESFASSIDTTFVDSVRNWLGDVGNGIQKIFAREIQTDKLCINQTCITENELLQLLSSQSLSGSQPDQVVDSEPVPEIPEIPETPEITDPEIVQEPVPEPIPEPIAESTNEPEPQVVDAPDNGVIE